MNYRLKWMSVINIGYLSRRYSQKPNVRKKAVDNSDLSLIRNIGILAHIDAGKTTTTERMLFYSGTISQMGEVHHGNTVTDFMEQERQRGITITSAAVTFHWKKHIINLLDTPGHIDFTMEVEQTLNVMDGAVVILDGASGVEAQTITVWKQANRHKIPRILYINKMDKTTSKFFNCVESVKKQFQVIPIILQLPLVNESKVFKGVVDILSLRKCEWESSKADVDYSEKALDPSDGALWENALSARIQLTETLADLDDDLAEMIIAEQKKLEDVPSVELKKSIRKVTLNQTGVPILCGSSYKNIAVQLLMDGVNDYLPSPLTGRSGQMLQSFGNQLSARAFKVRHDEHKGPITFFRIYSGSMSKGQKLYNVKKEKMESCAKLYVAYADDYDEVPKIEAGNVAAVTGLKLATAGDLVTSSATAFSNASKSVSSKDEENGSIFSTGALVPDPVFFCSIEAPSQSRQAALDKALAELEREDPSLKVSVSSETGQTVLGGMGELHLEIIKDRIRKEYGVEADSGPLQIAYKEALIEDVKDSFTVEHQIGTTRHSVSLTLSVLKSTAPDKEKLLLDRSPESMQNISSIFPKHLLAVKDGVEKALAAGPKLFCPVINVSAMLHRLEVGKGTSDTIIVSATIQSLKKLLKKGGTKLLEPLMIVEIVCTEAATEAVLNDLARRRAELIDTELRGTESVVRAFVPLSELLGYSTTLRIITSGRADISMEFHSFRDMNPEEEAKAIKNVTGFS